MNIYPVEELYNDLVYKRLEGDELSDYENKIFSSFELNVEQKAINDGGIIKNLTAERDEIAKAISILESKMFNIDNKIERVEYDLKNMLESRDIKKIKTPYFNITIALNNPSTNIFDEKEIPMDYIKQTVVQKIDRAQILKDLKLGVIIPGAEIQQKTRLEIK